MKLVHRFLLSAILPVALALSSCSDSTTEPPVPAPKSTFSLMQQKILASSCALSGCHAGTTPAGKLSLEESVAFANLINVTPDNEVARADGLLRVRPGVPDSSFFYLKVAGLLKSGHGARMPHGSQLLDSGRIEFIRQWIAAGAPKTGMVADTALLMGGVREFVPLPLPNDGYQLHLPPFTIPKHSEREIFSFMRSPNQVGIYVNKYQVRMRDNSHHFLIYNYTSTAPVTPPTGAIREQGDDMELYAAYRNLFVASQEADFTYELPPGVALYLPANSGLDFNSHYVNATDAPIQGEAYVNLYTIPSAEKIVLPLLWNNDGFVLAPNRTTIVRDTLWAGYDSDIYMLMSHTHRRGRVFRVYVLGGTHNGELLYESKNWHLPPVKTFTTPFRLNVGEALRTEVEYYNESEFPIRFGLTSEDEMSVLAGYYRELR